MGEAAIAARAEVLTARGAVEEQLEQLEASARAAVDIPAKVRRNPVRTAAVAGGAAFIFLRGPGKVYRRAKRAVFGAEPELPTSMLPKEIDETLRKLGTDGDRVRGTIERDFAAYLADNADARQGRDLRAIRALIIYTVVRPLLQRYGRRLVEELFSPDRPGIAEQLQKIRQRNRAATAAAPDADPTTTP